MRGKFSQIISPPRPRHWTASNYIHSHTHTTIMTKTTCRRLRVVGTHAFRTHSRCVRFNTIYKLIGMQFTSITGRFSELFIWSIDWTNNPESARAHRLVECNNVCLLHVMCYHFVQILCCYSAWSDFHLLTRVRVRSHTYQCRHMLSHACVQQNNLMERCYLYAIISLFIAHMYTIATLYVYIEIVFLKID